MTYLRASTGCWCIGTILVFCLGCGGAAGSSVGQSAASDTITKTLDSAGGTLAFPGVVSLRVPPGSIQDKTEVTLKIYSSPFAKSKVCTSFGPGVDLEVSRPLVSNSPTVTLTLEAPFVPGEEGWVAAIGSEPSLSFTHIMPERISDTEVQLRIDSSDLEQVSPSVAGSTPSIRLSFARAISTGSWSAGKLFRSPSGNYSLASSELEEVAGSRSLAGKNVAILIHGLNNSAVDMIDTAVLAQNASAATDTGPYDEIWLYDYHDTTAGIAENGRRMAETLMAHHIDQARHVDVYGHSMGGLVARWAIEQEELGAYVDRLFTFGTPHEGVPAQVLGLGFWYLYIFPGTRDLEDSSSFITTLDKSASPYKDKILYCTFAGDRYDNYFDGFGNRVASKYRFLGWPGAVDGIVAGYSANPSDISRFGVSNSFTFDTLHLNHSDIGGSDLVAPELKTMMETTTVGTIN
jgi:pimeloyl-ACP methyl ester carboxylesterase